MILLEIKSYIRENRQVKASNIKNKFDLSEETLEGLLLPLIEQGFIHKITTDSSCSSGTCHAGCASADAEYLWVGRKVRGIQIPVTTAL